MRISLYKHELEVVERLTISLVRLRQEECSHLATEIIGPEIFGKLLDAMYARGNYKHARYMPEPPVAADSLDFLEIVDPLRGSNGGQARSGCS